MYEPSGAQKDTAKASMNCPCCQGRLWLEDFEGDFYPCEYCNATGEAKYEVATVTDISVARDLRDSRRAAKVVSNDSGNDAA